MLTLVSFRANRLWRLAFFRPDASRQQCGCGLGAKRVPMKSMTSWISIFRWQNRRLFCALFGAFRRNETILAHCASMLERNAEGPVIVDDRKIAPPPRGEIKTSMEALIHHFKLFTEGYHVRRARPTRRSKRPRANSASIWWRMEPTSRIAAIFVAPVLRIFRRQTSCARDTCWPDAVAIIGSMDLVFGEVDR